MVFWPSEQHNKNYGKVFLTGFLVAAIIFIPSILYNRGILLISNDFNTQQLPFYVLGNEQIKSGEFFFSNLTDLGTPFIGSYLFYMLGSPFFWLTVPFPSWMVPYLMGPLLMLKFAVASFTSYVFICRYVKDGRFAMVGALLYAYSGFQIFNMFYNHFHDMTAFFPLLLIALDELVENKRRGWFALAVALNFSTNYILFVGEAMFVVAYYIVKVWSGKYKFTLRSFIHIAVEAALGMLCVSYALTAIAFVADNPRTEARLTGWSAFVYYTPMKYIEILRAFLFPSDTPHIEPFYPKDANTRWQSLQAYIPLFSFAGAITFIRTRRKSFVSRMLILCSLTAFIPILNSMPYLFNSFYYARWYYMFLLMAALATAMCLEQADVVGLQLERTLKQVFAVQLIFVLVVLFFPSQTENGAFTLGLADKSYLGFLIAYAAIALCGSAYAILSIQHARGKASQQHLRAELAQRLLAGVLIAVLINGSANVVIMKLAEGKTDYYSESYIQARDAFEELKTDDSFRLDTSRIYYNAHMWWGIPSMATFNSNISASEMRFYEAIGEPRFVATFPDDNLYGLRALFSVKYVVYAKGKEDILPDLHLIDTKLGYDIYENESYVPMGFTYDYCISEAYFSNLAQAKQHMSLLQSLVLTEEQIERYRGILTPIMKSGQPNPMFTTYTAYKEEVQKRADSAAYDFEWTQNGFSADISLDKQNLVFFSVPYDEGFTATVNGEPAQIERVNIGFMAVLCDPGENHIEFSYYPRGFTAMVAVSVLALLSILTYMLLPRIRKARRSS